MKGGRASRDQQKKLEDDAKLIRAWRAWHKEQLDEACASAHGAIVSEVMTVLNNIEQCEPSTLLDLMRHTDWRTVGADVRLVLLHQTSEKVMSVRERAGLPPIDDGFDHEPDGLFRRVKQLLFP